MPYDPDRHHRRSIRLREWDYANAGAYFVTLCIQGRLCLFGSVINESMQLNDAGQLVYTHWIALPERFPTMRIDEFVIMPNHFHAILFLLSTNDTNVDSTVGAPLVGARNQPPTNPATRKQSSLGDIVGTFTLR